MKSVFTLLLGSALLLGGAARAAVIDFGSGSCSPACANGAQVQQTFGDTTGLQVTYNDGLGNSLYYWQDGYSQLSGVAYAANGAMGSITLKADRGYSLKLRGLLLGAWLGVDRNSSVRIVNGVGDVLYESGAFVVPGASGTGIVGKWKAKKGITIEFGPDAYFVAIDQIDYSLKRKDVPTVPATTPVASISPVPLPAGLPLLAGGLGLLGLVRRRRRRQG